MSVYTPRTLSVQKGGSTKKTRQTCNGKEIKTMHTTIQEGTFSKHANRADTDATVSIIKKHLLRLTRTRCQRQAKSEYFTPPQASRPPVARTSQPRETPHTHTAGAQTP